MQYYKWIQSNEPIITQIPQYVYTSLEKAYEHKEPNKTLYSFEGLDENIIKQKLLSLPKSASGTLLYLWNVTLTQVNDFIITQSKGTCCISLTTLTLNATNFTCSGSTSYTLTQTGVDTWTGSGATWCTGPTVNFTFVCNGSSGTLTENCGSGDTNYTLSINCSGPIYWGPTVTGTFSSCPDSGAIDYSIT